MSDEPRLDSWPESSPRPETLGEAILALSPLSWTERVRPELELSGPRSYLAAPLDDLSPRVVLKKGVQIGATETVATGRALHFIDLWRRDVLLLFPIAQVASEFSAGRFDPLLARNEHLRELFTDVANVHHKRAGTANFYCRGSNSESQLVSVPVSLLVVDEFDRMDLSNLGLARDRLQGQRERFELDVSTPTYPGLGIDLEYSRSDRRRWLLSCPNCKERRPLSWASVEFVEADPGAAKWRCSSCAMPWSEDDRLRLQATGRWVAETPGAPVRGYHVPGLLNPYRTAADFAARWIEVRGNETLLQTFHNSVLGEAYSQEGSRITDDLLLAAQTAAPYPSAKGGKDVAVGVDVGAVQHVVIVSPEPSGRLKVLRSFTIPTLEALPGEIAQYKPACVVIDSMPERQKAREIQARLNLGRWECCWLALYPEMKEPIRWNRPLLMVDIHRTEGLDEVVALFRGGLISLPLDTPEEFKSHLRAPVRVNEPDPRTGNLVGRWRESGPDHYAHALAYAVAASKRARASAAPARIEWL